MLQTQVDFLTLLVRRKILSVPQMDEARQLCQRLRCSMQEAVVRLGYASGVEVLQALADAYGVPFVEIEEVMFPPETIELIPESVARENTVLPMAQENGRLMVLLADPSDEEVLEKLRFILNKEIDPVVAPREQIIDAIDRHYGQTEQESVDSMLAEFTDTQISFEEEDDEEVSFEMTLDDTDARPKERDIFETDFDMPARADESASLAAALEEEDNDLESSDFDLGVESGPRLGPRDDSGVDEMLVEETSPVSTTVPARMKSRAASLVERHATVRYFYRMNPLRMYPLFVIISKRQIQEIVKKHVAQKRSDNFEVALDTVVEVEPILPGCQCYPPRESLTIRREEVSARFHVVPGVLGKVEEARVVVRQNGTVLAEVPLEMRIVKQGLTVLMGGLSLVLPFGLMVLKHFHLDFESQQAEGFGLYARTAQWAVQSLTPEKLAGILLLLTGALYLWLRPRQRDVFWDLRPLNRNGNIPEMAKRPAAANKKEAAEGGAELHAGLLAKAEEKYEQQHYASALRHYSSAFLLGPARPIHYHHASLCAYHGGDKKQALEILEELESKCNGEKVPAAIWYNMGCFCSRLGRFTAAIRYLTRAAEAGYDDIEDYRKDPDLQPMRWRSDFKRLLGSLKR